MAARGVSLWLKVLGGLAVAGVLTLGAATWALKKYLPPERVRELILTQARKVLGREVRVGDVEIGALQGLVVKNLKVSERPDFAAGEFASLDSFQVRVRLLPLLSRKVAVDKVRAEGLTLSVHRFADGNFNFSDIAASSAAGAAGKGAPAAALPLAVSMEVGLAELGEARIKFRDELSGAKGTLSIAAAAVRRLRLSGPFGLAVKAELDGIYGKRPVKGAVDFDADVDLAGLRPSGMTATFGRFSAETLGMKLVGNGVVRNLEGPSLTFRADVSGRGVEGLEVIIASAALANLKFEPIPDFYAEFQATSKGFTLEPIPELKVPTVPVPEATVAFKGVWRGGDLEIASMRLDSPRAKLTGKGAVGGVLSGRPTFKGSVAFDVDTPEIKASDLPVRIEQLPAGLVLPAVKGKGTLDAAGSDLSVDAALESRFGKVQAKGTVSDYLSPKPRGAVEAQLDLEFPETKASDLPVPVAGMPAGFIIPAVKIRGRAGLRGADLSVDGLKLESKWGGVEVAGTVGKALSGKPEPQIWAKLNLDLPETPAAMLPMAPKGLPAGFVIPALKIRGKAGLRGTQAELDGFRVESPWGSVEASGSVAKALSDKPEPNISARLNLKLPEIPAASLPLTLPGLRPGLKLPAAQISGGLALAGDNATLSGLEVRTALGRVVLSGAVAKVLSGKPAPKLDIAALLKLPAATTSDLPLRLEGMPPGVAIPAAEVEGKVRVSEDELRVESLEARIKEGRVSISGVVRGWLGPKPDPDLQVNAALNLPAIKSADIPLPGVPQGLEFPEMRLEADVRANRDKLRARKLRVEMGKNHFELDVSINNLGLRDPAAFDWRQWLGRVDLKIQASLAKLSQVTPQTRELNLTGLFFGEVVATGRLVDPTLNGTVQFKDLGLKAWGLEIAGFTGEARFDPRLNLARLDIPRLKGRVGAGTLEVDYTVMNYDTLHPKFDIDAKLDVLDLEPFLEAKRAFSAGKAEFQGRPAKGDGVSLDIAVDIARSFKIGKLRHPNLEVSGLDLSLQLRDVTPDLKRVSGSAKVKIGPARFMDLAKMIQREPALKALSAPIRTFQSLPGILGFPDLNKAQLYYVDGDYEFDKGVMTLKKSLICGRKLEASAEGTINLADERLDLRMLAQAGNFAPKAITVTGTISNPEHKIGKFIMEMVCPRGG